MLILGVYFQYKRILVNGLKIILNGDPFQFVSHVDLEIIGDSVDF